MTEWTVMSFGWQRLELLSEVINHALQSHGLTFKIGFIDGDALRASSPNFFGFTLGARKVDCFLLQWGSGSAPIELLLAGKPCIVIARDQTTAELAQQLQPLSGAMIDPSTRCIGEEHHYRVRVGEPFPSDIGYLAVCLFRQLPIELSVIEQLVGQLKKDYRLLARDEVRLGFLS